MDEKKLAELMQSIIHEEIKGLQSELNGRLDKIEDVQREMFQMLKDSHTEVRSEASTIHTRQQRVIESFSLNPFKMK